MSLRAVLLLSVSMPNYGYEAFASVFGGSMARWQYILEGVAGAVLFAVLMLAVRDRVAWAICAWGATECALKGVCGAIRLYEQEFAPGGYVCASGESMSIIGASVALFIAWGMYAAKRT